MPNKFRRGCLVCGALSYETRCAIHEAEYQSAREHKKSMNPIRQAKKAALYNSDYRRRRQQVVANAVSCHICNKPFGIGDRIEADHLEPSNPASALAPAHAQCNQSRGNRPL